MLCALSSPVTEATDGGLKYFVRQMADALWAAAVPWVHLALLSCWDGLA